MAISTKGRKKDDDGPAPRSRARRRHGEDGELPGEAALSSVGSAKELDASPTDDSASPPAAFAQFPLVRLDLAEELLVDAEELPPAVTAEGSVDTGGQGGTNTSDQVRKSNKRPGKVRSEVGREQQRKVATAQRLRHEELVKTWMPSQRGANMVLATRIGSQTVEGWFKRTFVRLSRMLYRIHTFPMHQLGPEAIALIEKQVLGATGVAEKALTQQVGRCEEMLERVGGRRAFYSKHFELEIIVSTKTAMALHAVYHRADEVMLLVESLDFAGILSEPQRRKQIGGIHAVIFGLAQSIERLHRGLYVRVVQSVAEVAEVDAVMAASEGKPIDLDHDQSPVASAREPEAPPADD